MKRKYITLCATILFGGVFLGTVSQASASWFSRHHPRRAEVDRREERQQERITHGLRNGSLTPAEAQQLESQERTLRSQERAEVRANGGSLSRQEYRQLNHEEDNLSREIHHDTHN
jgi:hypothetical protein